MDINLELRTPTMEWVFLKKLYEATAAEVVSHLKRLKSIYPDNLIRAVNVATGKIIDLI